MVLEIKNYIKSLSIDIRYKGNEFSIIFDQFKNICNDLQEMK